MLKYTIILITLVSKLALISLNAEPAVQPWQPEPGCFPTDPCDS